MNQKSIELIFFTYLHFFVHALRLGATGISTLYDALRRSTPSGPPGLCRKNLLFIRRFWSVGITRLTCRPWLVAVRTVGIDFDAFWGPVGSRTDFPLMFYCCFRVVAWSQHPWRGSVWAIRADHRFPLLVLHKINRTCTKNSLKSEPRFKSLI